VLLILTGAALVLAVLALLVAGAAQANVDRLTARVERAEEDLQTLRARTSGAYMFPTPGLDKRVN